MMDYEMSLEELGVKPQSIDFGMAFDGATEEDVLGKEEILPLTSDSIVYSEMLSLHAMGCPRYHINHIMD
jgi:hypothetical protein